MEKLSYALAQEFPKHAETSLITWGKSQKYLPYFIPTALIKSLRLILKEKINHIHIGDALLSPLGLLLKTIFGIRTTVTVVGLDITFNFPGYQFIVPRCVSRLDKIICISKATLEECIKRGIPRSKCTIIPCGVYPDALTTSADRKELSNIIKKDLRNKKVVITVGRLVKRKGVFWFIKNVLPRLDKNIIYFVIGEGPEKKRIELLVKTLRLHGQVILLGKISDYHLKVIYNAADLFIMPNIKIDHTIEGFGIVALEASSAGIPVIANNIEGIADAVIHNKTGILVNPNNPPQMISAINNCNLNRDAVRKTTLQYFSWHDIGRQYFHHLSVSSAEDAG